jgi:hypothetical protein
MRADHVVLTQEVRNSRKRWTMEFADDHARDRLFFWLIHRLDRWEAWTVIARRDGAQTLTEHFLHLRLADEPIELA